MALTRAHMWRGSQIVLRTVTRVALERQRLASERELLQQRVAGPPAAAPAAPTEAKGCRVCEIHSELGEAFLLARRAASYCGEQGASGPVPSPYGGTVPLILKKLARVEVTANALPEQLQPLGHDLAEAIRGARQHLEGEVSCESMAAAVPTLERLETLGARVAERFYVKG